MSTHAFSWSVRSETHLHAEFNVLKLMYWIEQESHPTKELLPYCKIKLNKLRTHLNGEAEIKQNHAYMF